MEQGKTQQELADGTHNYGNRSRSHLPSVTSKDSRKRSSNLMRARAS